MRFKGNIWVADLAFLGSSFFYESCLGYFDRLVDEYCNTYHYSIGKKPINADSVLTEEFESSHKASKFKVRDRVRITKHKNIFSKGYTKKLVKRSICYWFCVK